jgi:Uncharacterized protein conserved in bacteria
MKILIDGDACPVKEIIYSVAFRYGIEVVLILSISHFSLNNRKDTVYVDSVSQAVDMEIVNRCAKDDIVVTGDYGLASLCLMKGCFCISFSGKYINSQNIDELLNIRFIGQKIREGGGKLKGPSKRTYEDDDRFEKNLERIIIDYRHDPQLEL